MLLDLRQIHPNTPSSARIQSSVRVEGVHLICTFDVQAEELNVNPKLSSNKSAFGLWDYDVVELFVACKKGACALPRYFEFNVSPLDQFFELEIFEPRKRVNENYTSNFEHYAKVTRETDSQVNWHAQMKVPLIALGFEAGDTLVGNLFACLGSGSNRLYFSAFLPSQDKPDFHLPEYFQALTR